MHRVLLAAASFVALIITQSARSADLALPPLIPAPMPLAVAAYNWSGLYVGGNVGYAWGRTGFDSYGPSGLFEGSGAYDWSGMLGGGQVGFNYMAPANWLIGAEADFDFSPARTSLGACATGGCSASDPRYDEFGTARLRIGQANHNLLFYGTGGLAWSHAATDRTITCAGATCAAGGAGVPSGLVGMTASSSVWQPGWAAGIGFEWAFLPHVAMKVEYLHMQFDGIGRDFFYPGFPTATLHNTNNTSVDTVRVGINYLFNWTPAPLVVRN